MRNKKIPATPFRWMLRRYLFLFVAVFLIAFAVFPMQGMIRILTFRSWMENGIRIDPQLRNDWTRQLTLTFVYSPLNLEMLCIIFGSLGFAAAMTLFRHLFSRKQGMMYAALPVRREKDFLLRTEVYAVCCLLPLLLCLALHPLMIHANGLGEFFQAGVYWQRAGAALLINMYGFALGALCASLFGTLWSAALGGVLISVSVEAVIYSWIIMAGWYLRSLYVYEVQHSALRFSPVYSLYKNFYLPGSAGILPGLLGTALMLALALWARRRVLPENAGHTLNCKGLAPLILGWGTVLGGTGGAMVFTLYLGEEAMLFLGLIVGALLAWVLIRMLLDQRVHLSRSGWPIPLLVSAAMLVVMLGLRGDWTGFESYTPQAEDLQAIRIDQRGARSTEEIRLEGEEALQAGLAWAAQSREEALSFRRECPFNPSLWSDAVIRYETKDGRVVSRLMSFPEDRTALRPALEVIARAAGIQQSEQIPAQHQLYAYSSLNRFGVNEFKDTYGFNPELKTSPRSEEIREALRLDLAARTLDTWQQPTLAYIYNDVLDSETGLYEESLYRYYSVKPGDQHLMKLLLGEDAEKWIDYIQGGFARSEEIRVFLCEYADNGNERPLVSYTMAESDAQVREWIARCNFCDDDLVRLPCDTLRQLCIYNLNDLSGAAEEMGYDLEDPEVLSRLPEIDAFWARSWPMTAE